MKLAFGFALVASVVAASAAPTPSPRDAALEALTQAKAIYEKICEASPQKSATVLPAAVEVRLSRALVVTSDLLAKGDDRELLAALIDYTSVSDCSADQTRALTLARVFRARPEALQAAIAALPAPARCKLVGQLQWGWTNDFLPAPSAAGAGADREARLTKLKSSVPAKCWTAA